MSIVQRSFNLTRETPIGVLLYQFQQEICRESALTLMLSSLTLMARLWYGLYRSIDAPLIQEEGGAGHVFVKYDENPNTKILPSAKHTGSFVVLHTLAASNQET